MVVELGKGDVDFLSFKVELVIKVMEGSVELVPILFAGEVKT